MKKCIKCGVFLAMPMSDYCTNCNPSNIDVSQGQIGKGPQQQTQNIQHKHQHTQTQT